MLLEQSSEGLGQNSIMFDKSTVEASEPQETSQLFDIGGSWTRDDSLDFCWVCGNAVFTNNVPKIRDACLSELALG